MASSRNFLLVYTVDYRRRFKSKNYLNVLNSFKYELARIFGLSDFKHQVGYIILARPRNRWGRLRIYIFMRFPYRRHIFVNKKFDIRLIAAGRPVIISTRYRSGRHKNRIMRLFLKHSKKHNFITNLENSFSSYFANVFDYLRYIYRARGTLATLVELVRQLPKLIAARKKSLVKILIRIKDWVSRKINSIKNKIN